MNKNNMEKLKHKIKQCKNTDLNQIELEDVNDIEEIKINRNKPSKERILDFIKKTKNPYIFRVNDKLVKFTFSKNEQTADDCLTNILKNIYK